MESYEVQLKDFKKAEQELTGKERVFISQDNNTRSTTIDEIRKPLAEQLNESEDNYYVSPSNVTSYWDSPSVPSINPKTDTEENRFADVTWKYPTMISKLYEELRRTNEEYITRISKGKDASGLYDWFVYKFEPKHYEKTVIIQAGIHGGERLGIYTLYRFLYHLVNDWNKYSQLSYVRNKVRLIIIPCANPWGQCELKRQNFNGVDLNRNFDYLWDEFTSSDPEYYKGTSPFSEVETQYIKSIMEEYHDATTFLSFHNYGSVAQDFILFTSAKNQTCRKVYRELINHLSTDNTTERWGEENKPTCYNYASKLNFHSADVEFPMGKYGNTHGAEDMTHALRWYGNVILQHCKLDAKPSVLCSNEGFIYRVNFNKSEGKSIVISSNTYNSIQEFDLKFKVPTSGIVKFSGNLVLYGANNINTQAFITPKLCQKGTDFPPEKIQDTWWETYTEGINRTIIPFSAEIPVIVSNDQDDSNVLVGLYAKRTPAGDGEITVYRYRGTIEFIPCDSKNRFKMYTATNRDGEENAMRLYYEI